jgi:hypothetical protein
MAGRALPGGSIFDPLSFENCGPGPVLQHVHVFRSLFTGKCAKLSTIQYYPIENYAWHPYLTSSQVVPLGYPRIYEQSENAVPGNWALDQTEITSLSRKTRFPLSTGLTLL